MKILKGVQMFWPLFPLKKLHMYIFLQKNGFGFFWADFSQTHLVTLLDIPLQDFDSINKKARQTLISNSWKEYSRH
jgi:hypothetical protein